MIVNYLDLFGSRIRPPENDPPLVIDADRILAKQITFERLEHISRRHGEVAQGPSTIDLHQFAPTNADEIGGKTLWRASSDKN
jgi:hypothetical protein